MSKKSNLGKGLEALISQYSTENDGGQINDALPLKKIRPNKNQPRKDFNWSHPIVYFAGKKIGWSYLCEKDSRETFEAFRKVFYSLKKQAKDGINFEIKNNKEKLYTKPFDKKLFKKLRKKYKV